MYQRESVRLGWNVWKCVSLTLNAWELAALWTSMCLVKIEDWVNVFPQSSQE